LEWERFRRERGVPSFGTDFGEATYPQEAGLERHAVSFSKGCYLGQEVVCMLEMRGQVKRKLVQLTFEDGEGDAALSSTQASAIGRGAKVYVEATGDAVLGEVTSAPIAAAPIGFAMVKRQAAEPGTRVWVECSGQAEPIAARVTAVL
jgi:folate-binding protein YgfZ